MRLLYSLFAVFGIAFFAGCETASSTRKSAVNPRPPQGNITTLRPGDMVLVSLQSIPDASDFQLQIDDQGSLRLRYLGIVAAAGKTASELANHISTAYIDGNIYKNIDVSVTLTERLIYVGGEVKRPGSIQWTPDMTLTKAITAAGGFTLYAKETGVLLSREKESYTLDSVLAKDKPLEDVPILPGDSLHVPRSAF